MKDATSLEFKHSDASSNAASLAQFLGSIVAVRLVVLGHNVMIYSTHCIRLIVLHVARRLASSVGERCWMLLLVCGYL